MSAPTLHRLPAWQTRFAVLCQQRAAAPFAWGVHDCCLWAADAVHAITGHDFAAAQRGTYATTAEAARVLQAAGGVRGVATRALGAPMPAALAAVGDVVLLEQEGRELLAVCNGLEALAAGPTGLVPVPMRQALAAWRV
jgi:hypothetical protein